MAKFIEVEDRYKHKHLINIDHIIEIKISGYSNGDDIVVYNGAGKGKIIHTLTSYEDLVSLLKNAKDKLQDE